MNEKIRELMAKCNYLVDGTCDTSREEKFAELIVKECLDVMTATKKEADASFRYLGDDVPTCVHQREIAKHFGVEE
jgi:hypothetical protein